jgi:hypothetical protein
MKMKEALRIDHSEFQAHLAIVNTDNFATNFNTWIDSRQRNGKRAPAPQNKFSFDLQKATTNAEIGDTMYRMDHTIHRKRRLYIKKNPTEPSFITCHVSS